MSDKENVVRILKGQDKIQNFRCRTLRWHRWTTWDMLETDWERGPIGPVLRCYCADCGLTRFENPYSKTLRNNA